MSRRAGSPSVDRKARRRKRLEDPYFGHEEIATLCENFIIHLFQCPELPPNCALLPLKLFIARVICQVRLPKPAIFAGLFLLERLRTRRPDSNGTSAHRLFVSAALIASKLIVDDYFSNGYWVAGTGDNYSLEDINEMERKVLVMVDYDLSMDPTALLEFEAKVRRIFSGPGPYSAYALPHHAVHSHRPFPGPPKAAIVRLLLNPFVPPLPTTHTPSARSPPTSPIDVDPPSICPSPSTDSMEWTPELSGSTYTSPACSIVARATPDGYEDCSLPVVGGENSKGPIASTTTAPQVPTTASASYLLGALWDTLTDAAAAAGTSMTADLLTRTIASVW